MIIALFLWFHVVTERTYEETVLIPLELVDVPEGLVLANELPQWVKVKVVGKGKQLLLLRFSELKARLSLAYVRNRRTSLRLGAADVGISRESNVEVVKIEPDMITIDLERLVSKRVKVVPALRVIPAEGYTWIGPAETDPETVAISGPERFIAKVDHLTTDSLVVEGAKRDIERRFRVIPPEGVNVTCSPVSVMVHVDIQKVEERTIDVPVKSIHVPKGVQTRPKPETVTLTVTGGVDVLASLDAGDFSARVDYRAIKASDEPIVFIDVPAEVALRDAEPKSVKVVKR